MAVEEIELRLTVDGRPAQKALDDTRTMAQKLGGGLDTLRTGFGSVQKSIAPAAAAISGIAAALGQTNGAAGKAVAAAGQVAAAFAAGGPLGAGLAAGTFAVDALTQAWENELKAQDAALKQQYASLDTAVERLAKAKGQLDAIVASAQPPEWRISAERNKKLAEVDAVITENRMKLEALASKVKTDARIEEIKGLEVAIKKNEQERQAIIDTANAQHKAIADAKADRESEAFRAKMKADADAKAAAAKAAADRAAAIAEKKSADRMQVYLADLQEEETQLKAVTKASDERKKSLEEIDAQRRAMSIGLEKTSGLAGAGGRGLEGAQSELQRMAVEAAKNAAMADDWSLAWKKAGDDVAASFGGATGAINGAIGVAVQGTQQYLDDVITGQEHATERLAQLVMSQAGQALISSGTKLAGEAVVSAFTPGLQPLAVTQGAAAAGLIAGGIALGGVATAVGHVAAGGTIGQKLPEKSTSGRASDPGARARPMGAGAGGAGGGQNVTIIYGGISGPSADDGARALTKAARRANRRGFA